MTMRQMRWTCMLTLLLGSSAAAAWPAPRPLDPQRLAAAGLRIHRSEHCTLVTDKLEGSASLPRLIDTALPQWGERFGVTTDEQQAWRLRVYLMGDRSRFEALGLLPEARTDFPNGYALGHEVWLFDQPTDYYRRHLLLHEATHAFTMTHLGSCGPAWFMEGMAELLGTHVWDPSTEQLRLGVFPASRQAARHWGRVRLVRQGIEATGRRTIASLLRLDNRVAMPVESYAWLWALAKFLDTHPRYQTRWRGLPTLVAENDFDEQFRAVYEADWPQLEQEWRLFTTTLTYGHDIPREAILFQGGGPLGERPQTVEIRADRGWQSSGMRVEAATSYTIRATGRCVIARDADGTAWPSEAGGVTLAYHRGRPVGELLATVDSGPDAFVRPIPIGLGRPFRSEVSGTLYFRLNDAPNRLAENEGSLSVTLRNDASLVSIDP